MEDWKHRVICTAVGAAIFAFILSAGVGLKYQILLIGSLSVVPLCLDLFLGDEEFLKRLKSDSELLKIAILSFFAFEAFAFIVKAYVRICLIPH